MLNLISLLGHNNLNASYFFKKYNYNYTLTFSNIPLALQGPPSMQCGHLLKLSTVVIDLSAEWKWTLLHDIVRGMEMLHMSADAFCQLKS